MWMEVHIYILKAKSQAGNIWVKDIMATQKGQSQKKISEGSSEIYAFCWKILLKASGPGEGAAGVTHLWEYTQKAALSSPEKLLLLYLVVQWRVQLEHSSHIVQVGVEATY